MNKTKEFKHLQSFDSMRGFGCLLVLVAHGSYGLMKGAWLALDLFFIASGFLITSLLLKEYLKTNDISLKRFYWRRALRILPALCICILLANILWPFTNFEPGANQALATFGGLFYFINFLHRNITGNLLHLWSLSVEEHFYLFWPLLLLFFVTKISFKKKIWFLIILMTIVAIARIVIFNSDFTGPLFTIDAFRSTFCRVDTISLGVLLAFIANEGSTKLSKVSDSKISILLLLILCTYVVIIFTVSETNSYLNNGGFIITNFLAVFTVLLCIEKPNHYLYSNKALQWVGKRSYGLYLYHFPIFLFLEQYRQEHNHASFIFIYLLKIFVSIVITAISYKYIEEPILKYKKKFNSNGLQKSNLKADKNNLERA